MEIVFITSYYNHHQAALAECLDIQTGHCFTFIETEPMSTERKNMGWSNENVPAYVKKAYASERDWTECQQLINDADVVIWGSCPFSMIQPRLRARKLTFCYSERLFKKGFGPIAFGGRAVKYWLKHWRYQKNHYLLCASAYAAGDYAKIGLFRKRAYKWGYFPEVRVHHLDEILAKKREKQRASILWAGRLIDWKHPDVAILLAGKLKAEGYCFDLNIIGNGQMETDLRHMISQKGLEDCVHMLGSMSSQDVLDHMETADIFLFTSDQNEGWGAVVNEAMRCACAVVASNAAGSVQYLIENDKNGLVYNCGRLDELYRNIVSLLKDRERCRQLGQRAFDTMANEWSAGNTAKRFMVLAQALMDGREEREICYTHGPCSHAGK